MIEQLLDISSQLPGRILASLLTAFVIAMLGLTLHSVRQFLFYKRHEFDFIYDPNWEGCKWDIQWETFRVTIEASGVHNDHIEKLVIKKQDMEPGQRFAEFHPTDTFHQIDKWPLYFKLSSITRTSPKPKTVSRSYRLNFVLKLKRRAG